MKFIYSQRGSKAIGDLYFHFELALDCANWARQLGYKEEHQGIGVARPNARSRISAHPHNYFDTRGTVPGTMILPLLTTQKNRLQATKVDVVVKKNMGLFTKVKICRRGRLARVTR